MHQGIQEKLAQIFTHRWNWIIKENDSWQEEFEEFYNQAIEAGYCEDLPINWLSRNHRNEPMVRVNRPWNGTPYTLLYWREAMQEFWGNRRNES